MENYDVVIVGAGIAGTGLAYNLSQQGYKGSVLVIDKERPGASAAYGYRNTTERIIKEFNLPYSHKFKGLKIGAYDEIFFSLEKDFYFLDYKMTCENLLGRSSAEFKNDEAVSVSDKMLKTKDSSYGFKYLIDCGGAGFFLKKHLKQTRPFRYWIGTTNVLKNTVTELDNKYYYFLFDDVGFLEEFYLLNDRTLHGFWQYTKKIDFNLIKPPQNTFLKNYIPEPEIIETHKVVGPASPVFPLSYKNYAFLGDSFGNANSAGVGIAPILNSASMLADSIKRNDLKMFEKDWKKKYMKPYLLYLTNRVDKYNNPRILNMLKHYPRSSETLKEFRNFPELFNNFVECDSIVELPRELKNMFPKHRILWQLYHYLALKLRYLFMEYSANIFQS